jgi:hypothetical protein
MDEITKLADRLRAKQRRGEELGLEFEVEYGALTDEERDGAHGADGAAGRSWEGTV